MSDGTCLAKDARVCGDGCGPSCHFEIVGRSCGDATVGPLEVGGDGNLLGADGSVSSSCVPREQPDGLRSGLRFPPLPAANEPGSGATAELHRHDALVPDRGHRAGRGSSRVPGRSSRLEDPLPRHRRRPLDCVRAVVRARPTAVPEVGRLGSVPFLVAALRVFLAVFSRVPDTRYPPVTFSNCVSARELPSSGGQPLHEPVSRNAPV